METPTDSFSLSLSFLSLSLLSHPSRQYFDDAKWNETYEQWPMVFAMGGMFVMSVIE